MTGGGAQREDTSPEAAPAPNLDTATGAPAPVRLSLGDPLDGRASEDRPEAWGERSEDESDRLAHYRAQTPPHHGN